MPWNTYDLVALSLTPRLTHADRIRLIRNHSNLEGALPEIGQSGLGLEEPTERVLADCESHNVRIVGWGDESYPRRLAEINAPPSLIYIKGDLPDEDLPTISVVGTRTCTTHYGKPATEKLVTQWVHAGIVIISGLANGIDTLAHDACLRARGTTVAVIASGLGRIMPKNADRLADKIADQGGCVIAEHPFHVAALPHYFPARNRIISGLSDAVVVIESKETGGALITADLAFSAGRPVWAVPGPITSTRSIGTNRLIRDGTARILTEPNDVVTDLGLTGRQRESRPLPPDLEALGADPLQVDDIARRWKCSVPDALIKLAEHEFDGLVKQLPGKQFIATP